MSLNILQLNAITKSFGGNAALSAVSLELRQGEIAALIGPNGAGKTTLFDIVTGFVRCDSGSIVLHSNDHNNDGIDITYRDTFVRARLGISRTFQHVRLCENLTIEDHFRMVEDHEDEKLFKNIMYSSASSHEQDKRNAYLEFLHTLDLRKPPATRVIDLSYGQRKLLDFGLAVCRKHAVLLLDEPVAGVNPVIRTHIHQLLQDLKKKGETVMFIEHNIDFVRAIADIVIVLDEGRIIVRGRPDEVFSDRNVREAYIGI